MSIEILDCLKRKRDICVKAVITSQNTAFMLTPALRWLETVSSTYTLMGRYNHLLSRDATIMVSKNCPTIGEHVVVIFVTQQVSTIATL